MRRRLTGLAAALPCLGVAASAAAQAPEYPNRPIVTFPPGGTADALARIIDRETAGNLGQGVVVENRSGASGLIGTEQMAKAAADGYTSGVISAPQIALPFAARAIAYDPRSLRPVASIATVPGLPSAHPSLAARSLQDIHRHAAQRCDASLAEAGGARRPVCARGRAERHEPGGLHGIRRAGDGQIGMPVTHSHIRLD